MIQNKNMAVTQKEQQSIDYYHTKAHEWSERYKDKKSFWQPELQELYEYVPSGKLLEIGVGGGLEAKELIEHGYSYTGIEPAQNLLDILQSRFSNSSFLLQNVLDLSFREQDFDAFWCSAVLLHVSPENILRALCNIHAVLKPGAIGFISLIEGSGEVQDPSTGRWFFLYQQKEFIQLLQQAGFTTIKQGYRTPNNPNPIIERWLTFFVKRQ